MGMTVLDTLEQAPSIMSLWTPHTGRCFPVGAALCPAGH